MLQEYKEISDKVHHAYSYLQDVTNFIDLKSEELELENMNFIELNKHIEGVRIVMLQILEDLQKIE